MASCPIKNDHGAVGAYGSEERRKLYLTEYERLAGEKLQYLEWFEALACSLRLRDVIIAISNGPEKLGWRPDVASTVMEHMAGNRQTYEFLLERTGIRMPEVDALLAIPQ